MFGDWPQYGNTFSAVSRLAAALPQISKGPERFTSSDPVPQDLQVGDLIRWNNSHFTVIIATNPIQLAYHSNSVFGASLSTLFAHHKEATGYHIIGGTISAPLSYGDPKVLASNSQGQAIQPSGWTRPERVSLQIQDDGAGFGDIEVTGGAPILDSMENLDNGTAHYVFIDHTSCATTNHVCNVDLSSLQNGTSVFIQAFDAAGNVQVSNFAIATSSPTQLIYDTALDQLVSGSYTQFNSITNIVTPTMAPVASVNVVQASMTSRGWVYTPYYPPAGVTVKGFTDQQLTAGYWYWSQACDIVGNCGWSLFGVFGPDGPPPGQPLPPTPDGQQPPASAPVASIPPPNQPSCHPTTASLNAASTYDSCVSNPTYAQVPTGQTGTLPPSKGTEYRAPGDPNSMKGPSGSVTPGQLMPYAIQFENVGSGDALGVYITDVLSSALDETTLAVTSMYNVVYSTDETPASQSPVNFPWTYDPNTRTVTVMAGNGGPSAGGSFVVQANLRSTTAPGTVINNQALVHFPNALQQITPTNIVTSAVPLPTQLSLIGISSGTFLGTASPAAMLIAGGNPVPLQPIKFQVAGNASTQTSNSSGIASTTVALTSAPGSYTLNLTYPGDGFYYLPSAANSNFVIGKRSIAIQAPFAVGPAAGVTQLTLTVTDDQGQSLLHQSDSPKTVYLEVVSTGGATAPLASSLVSGTTAAFQFSLPQPLQRGWQIQARFPGDAYYQAAASTGALSLFDNVPPSIAIKSPSAGQRFSGAGPISVSYSVTDNDDPAPSSTAYFLLPGSTQQIRVFNGETIPAASLSSGTWTLSVTAMDWTGNVASTSTSFQILSDVLPPRTSLAISSPSYGANLVYISSQTQIGLSAVDDRTAIGDGLGVVAQTFLAVDSSSFSVYSGTFTLVFPGTHTIQYYSIDSANNTEVVRVSSVAVDSAPPLTSLAVSSPIYNGFASSATLFTLSVVDPLVNGVASGLALTRYKINGGAFVSTPTAFGLVGPDGIYTISYQSVDNVGNTEVLKSTTVILDQTPPVTTAHVGLSSYTAVGGTLYVTPATPVTFTAVDPSSGTSASGVAQIQVAVDTGPFAVYPGTLAFAEGAHTVLYRAVDNVGNVETGHTLALQSDVTPPMTTLLPSGTFYASAGQNYAPATLSYTLSAQDPVSNGVASGADFTLFRISPAPFTIYSSTFGLAEGVRRVDFQSQDNVGNLELLKSATIYVDATPPVSSLVIGQPQFALSSSTVLVSSLTPIAITATDPISNGVASGVRQSFYGVAGGSFTVFSASFTLSGSAGPQAIAFYSVDNVGNAEVAQSNTVILVPMPPRIALVAPNPGDQGIGRVFKGRFPVSGTAIAQYLKSWTLDFAPGQNATTGFTLISSGTVNISSATLGTWDMAALSGWQTLRLSAVDLVQNASVMTLNVFVGDPGQLMILGNDDVFNLPQGVAIGPSGNIYVADTNDDRIAVFSSTGAPIASFGQPAQGGDDLRPSTSTIKLNQPRAVAVDASGDIFIADSLDNRVLELSSTGQLLLAIGRQQHAHPGGDHDDGDPGAAAGELNRPSGVALDGSGRIYVSDTLNSRVQVFSSTGAFLLAFSMPPLPASHDEDHDRDEKAALNKNLGRPYGIALDSAGRIYVADPPGGRALVFGATGQLLLNVPIAGVDAHGHAQPSRPLGVAASAAGDFFLVSDSRQGQVFKFDTLGDLTLTFGQNFRAGPGGSVPGIYFHKPAGLALDASGDLFVADRNNDRIKEFSLPTGQPTLLTPPSTGHGDDEAVAVLDQDEGGAVQRSDNAGIAVPSGALPDDLKVTVATASAASLSQASAQNSAIQTQGIMPAYAPVEYQPEGTQFAKPVTLTLPYDPALLASLNVSPQSLQVHYWNPKTQQWEGRDSTVDSDKHTVTAKTTHFSLYQVMIGSAAAQAIRPQAASNTVSTIQVACNPLRPGCQPLNFRNLPANARLRIYTLAGALVKDMTTDGSGLASWDGTNQSGQPTASGVYFVFAQGAGESKTIKIAVER